MTLTDIKSKIFSYVTAGFAKLAGKLLAKGIIKKDNLVTNNVRGEIMEKWKCSACGYVYDPAVGDPDSGIAPGTPFEQIPDDWMCPVCGVGKDMFEKM